MKPIEEMSAPELMEDMKRLVDEFTPVAAQFIETVQATPATDIDGNEQEWDDEFPVDEYYCQDCEEICNGVFVDFGIGPYEYWGMKGFDTRLQWVSDCCESTVMFNGVEQDEPEL